MLSGLILLLLVACNPSTSESGQSSSEPGQSENSNTQGSEQTDPFAKHKKILKSVTDFDVSATSGFDYLLDQKVGNATTNSHEISLRVNRKNDVKARRYEKVVKLNDKVDGEQFTITEETMYYHNNQVGRYEEGSWNWSAGEINGFTAVNIGNFNFDITKMTNVAISGAEGNEQLVFNVPNKQIENVFGERLDFNNVLFSVLFNPNTNELVEIDLSYNQQISATTFTFVPIYGDVTVIIPS